MADKRVIADFLPQVEDGKDVAPIWHGSERLVIPFDVTDQIVAMGREKALEIEDFDYSADDLWHSHVEKHPELEHDGPFEVRVEDAIVEFFGDGEDSETVIEATLKMKVQYSGDDADHGAAKELLESLVRFAADRGLLTGELDMVVEGYEFHIDTRDVEDIGKSKEEQK